MPVQYIEVSQVSKVESLGENHHQWITIRDPGFHCGLPDFHWKPKYFRLKLIFIGDQHQIFSGATRFS